MSTKYAIGDTILVPTTLLNWEDAPAAVAERKVIAQQGRKVKVAGKPGHADTWVATARTHRDIHVLLLRVGDFKSEPDLLDPITKSLGYQLKLLLSAERVVIWYLRTVDELQVAWTKDHNLFTHVVLISHGAAGSIQVLGQPGNLTGLELAQNLDAWGSGSKPKEVLSVACETGHAAFSKALSQAACVSSVTAPFQVVHGAVAVSYVQQYFGSMLLKGMKPKNARTKAAQSLPGGSHFVTWDNGTRVKR